MPEADDFYWLPPAPAYQLKREITERLRLLGSEPANPSEN
jgi:hypothetical protein